LLRFERVFLETKILLTFQNRTSGFTLQPHDGGYFVYITAPWIAFRYAICSIGWRLYQVSMLALVLPNARRSPGETVTGSAEVPRTRGARDVRYRMCATGWRFSPRPGYDAALGGADHFRDPLCDRLAVHARMAIGGERGS
jgi:hypothetical protein